MRSIVLVTLLLAGLLLHDAVRADTWLPPKTQTSYSANHQWRITVTPRAIQSPLAYFQDEVADKPNAGGVPGNLQRQAQGYLEHYSQGQWSPVWNKPLVNDVSPVTVIVSDQGWTASFDNWHSTGYGDHVVVIYGPDGQKIRQLALADFLSRAYIHGLPHSVSSIAWGGDHHFSNDGKRLVLQVVVPPDPAIDPPPDAVEYVDIALNTATGQLIPPQGPAWDAAQRAATLADAKLQTAEAAQDAYFKGPLHAPAIDDPANWHSYMIEAFFRTDRQWENDYPQTVVLSRQSDPAYQRYLGYLRDSFSKPIGDEGAIMLGSPDAANLVREIAAITRRLPPHRLGKFRIYVTVTPALREAAAKAITRTGARFIALDTSVPIPQRPERLRRYLNNGAQDD